MSDYIPLLYVDVIAYPCPNEDYGLANPLIEWVPGVPFTNVWIDLILAWISSHMSNKVWAEIIYPFSNFNGCTVEVWISNVTWFPITHILIHLLLWFIVTETTPTVPTTAVVTQPKVTTGEEIINWCTLTKKKKKKKTCIKAFLTHIV